MARSVPVIEGAYCGGPAGFRYGVRGCLANDGGIGHPIIMRRIFLSSEASHFGRSRVDVLALLN